MSVLDQPDSDIVPEAPAEAPSSSPSCFLLPGKTKNGGTCCPTLLAAPITVVFWDLPPVIAWALKWDPLTILGAYVQLKGLFHLY